MKGRGFFSFEVRPIPPPHIGLYRHTFYVFFIFPLYSYISKCTSTDSMDTI